MLTLLRWIPKRRRRCAANDARRCFLFVRVGRQSGKTCGEWTERECPLSGYVLDCGNQQVPGLEKNAAAKTVEEDWRQLTEVVVVLSGLLLG
jgi:hypothetical protein